jgi:hypothetical protein
MNWEQYLAALHRGGPELAALVDEAQGSAGSRALTTTRLLHDPEEMTRLARRIEDACEGRSTTLFTGIRAAEHLGPERRARFGRLAAGGVRTVLYGVGTPEDLPAGVVWVPVQPRSTALENQAFVVAEAPEPVALMSFAIPARTPATGAEDTDPGQGYAAFASRDPRLVEAVVRILRTVAVQSGVEV